MRSRPSPRAALLLVTLGILMAAMWAGLLRIGWQLPLNQGSLAASHGPLMISGFLGSLIALERVVALSVVDKSRWPYLAPIFSASGAIVLLLPASGVVGPLLISAGSLLFLIMFWGMVRRHPALHGIVMLVGALCWLVGNLLWTAGWSIHTVVYWWAGYLVLTIAGERLELSRLKGISPFQRHLFSGSVVFLLAALLLSMWSYDLGVRLVGVSFLLLAGWLLRNDIARRTVKQAGLPRFAAVCLLSGYGWLAAGGVLALLFGGIPAGLRYDAILHAIFLGFTFSMIFGHAPIIFPSILGIPIAYRPAFYAHLGLLHATLLLRIVADLTAWAPGRRWGGMLNVIVLLLFLANTAVSARQGIASQRT